MEKYKYQTEYAALSKLSLSQDIELWKEAVPKETYIKYHIQQFDDFFQRFSRQNYR